MGASINTNCAPFKEPLVSERLLRLVRPPEGEESLGPRHISIARNHGRLLINDAAAVGAAWPPKWMEDDAPGHKTLDLGGGNPRGGETEEAGIIKMFSCVRINARL